MDNLPTYRVHLSDGTSYITSMARGITLEDARAYFVTGRVDYMTWDRERDNLPPLTVLGVTAGRALFPLAGGRF